MCAHIYILKQIEPKLPPRNLFPNFSKENQVMEREFHKIYNETI